ncbi:MAG TPA: hypothetical protein VFR86_25770 [Burkholderiaceae bacterium]|nr:hypothetical protein [Burkholderiaceae bacterium]
MSDAWAWAALIGLGAFHGLNPAMGWLFAVALGLQRQGMRDVLWALFPIALGHALSIAIVVTAMGLLQLVVPGPELRWGAALLLAAFGVYRLLARHRGRAGMQVGFGELTLWSFLMATAHGAGLMLLPVLLNMDLSTAHSAHVRSHADSLGVGVAAVIVHTAAMLVVTGAVAVVVFRWVGLAFLRRGWINVDLIWSIALIAAAVALLIPF